MINFLKTQKPILELTHNKNITITSQDHTNNIVSSFVSSEETNDDDHLIKY